MEVTGRGGISLREQWGDEPTAYLGITIPNFPNLFCVYGPGTNLAHSASLFFHSEFQIHYAMDASTGPRRPVPAAIEVRPDVHDEYVERYQREIGQLVWAHPSITPQPLQEPAGEGLHAVALAARPLLAMDPRGRPRRLRHHLSVIS